MEEKLTKEEIIAKMRLHQEQYAEAAALYKEIKAVEEKARSEEKQRSRIAAFRVKYKYYIKDTKLVDWDEVEKLVTSSFDTNENYSLGYDSTGMPGLVLSYTGVPTEFSPMVEEEDDVRKYNEREELRQQFSRK